jgi:hypothetical protein
VVAEGDADVAVATLAAHHHGTQLVGSVTDEAGVVRIPGAGLVGTRGGFRPA